MALRSLTALLPLAALALAFSACQPAEDDADPTRTTPEVVSEDATVAWSATIEEDWDVTDALAAGDVLLVASSWDLEEDSAIAGYDADGNQLWEQGPEYGTIELTLLDDGTVQACDDLGGEILEPASGEVVREATAEECPEDYDGADTTADDRYEVDGSALVVYSDADLIDEQFRITLEDPDARAWGVDGGVATYSESSHQLRLYR